MSVVAASVRCLRARPPRCLRMPTMEDDRLMRMLRLGAFGFTANLVRPDPLTDEQLRSIAAPVLLFVAAHSEARRRGGSPRRGIDTRRRGRHRRRPGPHAPAQPHRSRRRAHARLPPPARRRDADGDGVAPAARFALDAAARCSSTTLRSRTLCGVTSTHSSSAMNSSACSSDIGRGGTRRTVSSEPAARLLVSFFSFVGFTSISSGTRVLADDHPLVDLDAGPDEHLAALLEVHAASTRWSCRAGRPRGCRSGGVRSSPCHGS